MKDALAIAGLVQMGIDAGRAAKQAAEAVDAARQTITVEQFRDALNQSFDRIQKNGAQPMYGTFEQRVAAQKEADKAQADAAKSARDAEIEAWHKSFGSTPANAPAPPGGQRQTTAAAAIDVSKLSASQLIELGLKQEREARQSAPASPAPAAPAAPADRSKLSANQLIELGLREESSLRSNGRLMP